MKSFFPSCVICNSRNIIGTFSMRIHDKHVVVCGKCSEAIREVSEDNIYDHQYDDFLDNLKGIREIAINAKSGCHFALSYEAKIAYVERAGLRYSLMDREDRHTTNAKGKLVVVDNDADWDQNLRRDDRILISVIKDLGERASLDCGIRIVRIPAEIEWRIESMMGEEWVVERHRVWY